MRKAGICISEALCHLDVLTHHKPQLNVMVSTENPVGRRSPTIYINKLDILSQNFNGSAIATSTRNLGLRYRRKGA